MTFPFLFSFCFGDDEGHGLLLGFFLFLLQEIVRRLAAQ
jgi:vacuolar-type H+-ATPase subunit I/STV1